MPRICFGTRSRNTPVAILGSRKLAAVSQVPPPPPAGSPPNPPTQVAGQQSAPSSVVPHTPGLPGYAPSASHTNSLAIVSLVTGIGSFFAHIIPGVGGATVAVIAIVTGFMARNQIRQSGEQGMWMATTGIVIGIIHLALIFVIVLVVLFVIFVLGVTLFGIAAHGGGAPTPIPSP